jgi:transcriptional regulator with XRE-family HTH domain
LGDTRFAAFLRESRGKRSKVEVERATRVRRVTLIRAERGERLLRVATLRRLMDYYDGDIERAIVLMNEARTERQITEAKVALIAIDEVAKRLGTTVHDVRGLIRTGALVPTVLGGIPLVDEHEVDRYIREHAADDRGRVNYREG